MFVSPFKMWVSRRPLVTQGTVLYAGGNVSPSHVLDTFAEHEGKRSCGVLALQASEVFGKNLNCRKTLYFPDCRAHLIISYTHNIYNKQYTHWLH